MATPRHLSAATVCSGRVQLVAAVLLIAVAGTTLPTAAGQAQPKHDPHGRFALPPLPYNTSALEPVVDAETMGLHHGAHHQAYVTNLNAAVQQWATGNATGGPAREDAVNLTLSEIVALVGTGQLPANISAALKNNAGGHWNHALLWKTMAPPGSPNTSTAAISQDLSSAINSSFGSFDSMVARFKAAAKAHFGSGWAWVCVVVAPAASNATTPPRASAGATAKGAVQGSNRASTMGGTGDTVTGEAAANKQSMFKQSPLIITTTSNQDNPLMPLVAQSGHLGRPCIPVLGLDVWEHAYYLKYKNRKPEYVDAWAGRLINWRQVSSNYGAAQRGDLDAIECEVLDGSLTAGPCGLDGSLTASLDD